MNHTRTSAKPTIDRDVILTQGEIVMNNTFTTDRGNYRITCVRYNNNVYMFKYRDNELLECKNLSTAKPINRLRH